MGTGSLKRKRKLPGFFDRKVYDALDGGKFAMTAIPLAHITATTEMGNDDEKEATTEEHETQDEALFLKQFLIRDNQEDNKVKEKHPTLSEWKRSMTQKGLKHRQSKLDECEDGRLDPLIKVLKRNSNPLNEQIQAQNTNCQLDRDQRKEHSESLVATINKLTNALERVERICGWLGRQCERIKTACKPFVSHAGWPGEVAVSCLEGRESVSPTKGKID
ncbi:hypothetical protein SLEP1_g52638 [Rubroshorea leprosula]|uniref:Uncharacterized protein n=1 Tax=Rubroshorea leprosula TaxID=152421 RepID=A0AAV5M7P4_9ROSI|nr:hypothetical protein SLEP1_g52638 [Rubroshorea leprosula]